MGEIITKSELARRLGLSASSISRLVSRGVIPQVARKRVDAEAATAAYYRWRYGEAPPDDDDPDGTGQSEPGGPGSSGGGAGSGRARPGVTEATADAPPPFVPDPKRKQLTQADANALDTQWRGYNRMLEALEKEGRLIEYQEVEAAARAIIVTISTQLDGLGGRLAQHLAGETDPAEVKRVIQDETRRIRAQVSEQLNGLAAGSSGGQGDGAAAPEGSGSVGGTEQGVASDNG